MEIVLFLWLAGISGALSFVLFCLGYGAGTGLIIWAVATYSGGSRDVYKKIQWKIGFIASICAIILAAILPSKETLYLMAGGYYGQKALQSETAEKVMTIINGHLDEKIKELTKK